MEVILNLSRRVSFGPQGAEPWGLHLYQLFGLGGLKAGAEIRERELPREFFGQRARKFRQSHFPLPCKMFSQFVVTTSRAADQIVDVPIASACSPYT